MHGSQPQEEEPLPVCFRRDAEAIKISWRFYLPWTVGVCATTVAMHSLFTWLSGQPQRFTPVFLWLAFAVSFMTFFIQRRRDQLQLGEDALRWPRIGLGGLLLLMTVFAIVFAWFGVEQRHENQARAKQQAIVTELAELVPTVKIHFSGPWNGAYINTQGTGPTDADIETIDRILRREFPDGPRVTSIDLKVGVVTDRMLEIAGGWRGVRHIWVVSPAVTDAGVDHLLGLIELEDLHYAGTSITEERIKRFLREMPSLGSYHQPGCIFEPD